MNYAIDHVGGRYATGDLDSLLQQLACVAPEWMVVIDSAGAIRAFASQRIYLPSDVRMELRSVAAALAAAEGGEFVLVRAQQGSHGWRVLEERAVRCVHKEARS